MRAFEDPSTFVALGRLTGLALSPDGSRLVAVRQEPDAKGRRYASALWALDPAGSGEPVRLTRSEQGETQPVFRPDNTLLFVSGRPEPGGDDDGTALWELPTWGEPRVVARTPGGLSDPLAARGSGRILARGSRLAGSTGADSDKAAREDRKERGLNHVLHSGFPIRYWDSELNASQVRLFAVDEPAAGPGRDSAGHGGDSGGAGGRDSGGHGGDSGNSGGVRDLLGDVGGALRNAVMSVDAGGRTVATTWCTPCRGGRTRSGLSLVDVASGDVRPLTGDDGYQYVSPAISPDGRWVAALRHTEGDFDTPWSPETVVIAAGGGDPVRLDTGDAFITELAWSGDGTTLVLSGDLGGRGVLLAVTPGDDPDARGWSPRRLAGDAVFSSVCVDSTGGTVYALRSTVARPPHPVRVDAGGMVTELRAPDAAPELPGTLTEVVATAPEGATVRAWLCVPEGADAAHPAPVQVWIHGGPFTSSNAWSWRWCPWVAVARGYAVLMPDPALSTGYGAAWFARAWPHRAATVWADVEAVLDAALTRDDLDARRTACLGGSFGGYMTNWIAGHTDRFGAIVTHAGLWALDQQHTTTDAADWKSGLFGTPELRPDWYAENSPHHSAGAITTPMLVVHGNRDYRVPVSEALRLWWDLVSRYDGEPGDLPHRFLQFTDENHWILTPGNAWTWYATVLDFVDRHTGPGAR